MRKFVTALMCLLLMFTVALSVSADGSAHMSISGSADTVYRGETFTLRINLTNDQPVSNGGVVLSFDSSVFQMVGGRCNVSNATLAEVSTSDGGGVFMMQTDTVVSGTIFTIEMKVRDDAAFGSYTISGTPSLSIPCSLSGTSVTVQCRHTLGAWSKADDNNHKSTCSICGETKTEAHKWNAGTVNKAATCKETGSKTVTCTVCNATKNEVIPVTNDHKYGPWSKLNATNHTHKCTVCNKEETVAHNWNSGEVITEANCLQTGYKVRTCLSCKETKNENIPKTGHNFTIFTSISDTTHIHTCLVCNLEETGDHTFDEAWENDRNWHFQKCDACDYKKDQAAHTPGAAATETTDQVCTKCSRVMQPKGAHTHKFANTWTGDESGHWHECEGCNERANASLHRYDGDCDADCNVCGTERVVKHEAGSEWEKDSTGHWRLCVLCYEQLSFSEHVPGPEATITAPQLCTECEYELAPIVPHNHVFGENGTIHSHKCACGEEFESDALHCEICLAVQEEFPWWKVCAAEAAFFVR